MVRSSGSAPMPNPRGKEIRSTKYENRSESESRQCPKAANISIMITPCFEDFFIRILSLFCISRFEFRI